MVGKKILIVDDEKDFVTIMKHFFAANGHEVIAAYDGIDALNKAKELPSIILLDINLPGMNGLDVLRKLRADSATQAIPVVMLTVTRDIKSVFEAKNLKATDYVLKSASMEDILATVKKYTIYRERSEALHQDDKPRKSGIDILNDLTWGKHICAFYSSKEDLLSLLIPYFKAGLLNNELCLWVISEDLKVEDAKAVLSKEIENLSAYIEKGQMKIIDNKNLYADPAGFDHEKAINFWIEEEKNALKQGFDGMRVSGSGNWADGPMWEALCNYEKSVNNMIGTKKIIAICTYSFDKFEMFKIITVGTHHAIIIAKQGDKIVNFAPTSYETFLEHFDIDSRGIKN